MAKPNGLARSSSYSGVAGGCSVETKARDKAVVTDGIKEMEELPGSAYIAEAALEGVEPWQDVVRIAAKAAPKGCLVKQRTQNTTGSQFRLSASGIASGKGKKGGKDAWTEGMARVAPRVKDGWKNFLSDDDVQ